MYFFCKVRREKESISDSKLRPSDVKLWKIRESEGNMALA